MMMHTVITCGNAIIRRLQLIKKQSMKQLLNADDETKVGFVITHHML